MQIIRNSSESGIIKKPLAIALGNFDGVHLGHRAIISRCVSECREEGWEPAVLTLEPHPALVLGEKRLQLINTLEQKLALFASLGVQYTILLPFSVRTAAIAPEDFVRKILIDTYKAKRVYCGFNYTFGQKGAGTSQTLVLLGEKSGLQVRVISPVIINGEVVSSSLIREKYAYGDLETAIKLLGYRPAMEGPVTQGEQRGRKLGFPTANMQISENILLPADGVYAVWAKVHEQVLPAVVNIGFRPTFAKKARSVEVHILDYQGDLYGLHMRIEMVKRIRPERRFASGSELTNQVNKDIQTARKILITYT